MCTGTFNYTSYNIFVGLGTHNYTTWDIFAMTPKLTSWATHAYLYHMKYLCRNI